MSIPNSRKYLMFKFYVRYVLIEIRKMDLKLFSEIIYLLRVRTYKFRLVR